MSLIESAFGDVDFVMLASWLTSCAVCFETDCGEYFAIAKREKSGRHMSLKEVQCHLDTV